MYGKERYLVPFSFDFVQKYNDRWSPDPMFFKFSVQADGTAQLWFSRPAPPPDPTPYPLAPKKEET